MYIFRGHLEENESDIWRVQVLSTDKELHPTVSCGMQLLIHAVTLSTVWLYRRWSYGSAG